MDGHVQYVRFSTDVSAERLSLIRDKESTGMSVSAETVYRFAFSLGGMDFRVMPQIELIWSRVGFDDFVGSHGEFISLEDGDPVVGRLGLLWDGEWRDVGGSGHIYGGINLRGALDGRISVSMSGISLFSEQRGLSIDGRFGRFV